ncbi:enoyl-CoA hydratase/isomerase family protein [Pontibacillus salipaludis]|uniref:enoyl-CoA hydratase/isomerase family protein n=1 Tax=Pontibacillus salipaludis TaxID=1697394 RepID=UPI0031E8E861
MIQGNDHLQITQEGPVLSCVLNRPDRLNAFSEEMITGLTRAVKEAERSDSIKAITISGAGRSFSAGGDVKEMGQATATDVYDHLGYLNELILKMKECSKPIIAIVHGFAAGAGWNLVLACDQILAAKESQFVLSFAQVGLVSDGGGSYFLTKKLGPYKAKELLFNAEPVSAQQAMELGLVNKVYEQSELEASAREYVTKIAMGPGRAISMMKKLVNQSETADLASILEQERITQTVMVSTEDHQEGVSAFVEKRKPAFTGQ